MVLDGLRKRLFRDVLYDDLNVSVVCYDGYIVVKTESEEFSVAVRFSEEADMESTVFNMGRHSSREFDESVVSMLEVRSNGRVKYRYGDPISESQYFVVPESARISSYRTGVQLNDSVSVKERDSEVVDCDVQDDYEVREVVGLSDVTDALYVHMIRQPPWEVPVDPLEEQVFDFQTVNEFRDMLIHLPNYYYKEKEVGINGSSVKTVTVESAVVSAEEYMSEILTYPTFGEILGEISVPVKISIDGYMDVVKTVTIDDHRADKPVHVRFDDSDFTEFGTVYYGVSDDPPDISVRPHSVDVSRLGHPPQHVQDMFDETVHMLYKFENVPPDQPIHVHHSDVYHDIWFDAKTFEVSDGETTTVYRELSYDDPIVVFENADDRQVTIAIDGEFQNIDQHSSIAVKGTDEFEVSVVDQSDGSVLETDDVVPDPEHRKVFEVTRDSITLKSKYL